jgi:cell division protease FtsH
MKRGKSFLFWVAIFAGLLLYSYRVGEREIKKKEIIFSEFMEKLANDEIKSIDVRGNTVYGKFRKDDEEFISIVTAYDGFVKELREKGVEVRIFRQDRGLGRIFAEIANWLPIIILIAFYYFSFKMSSGGSGNPFRFGKSRAKLLETRTKVTFSDVAGIDEAKGELKELVDFLREPKKYRDIGAKIPRGCLLIGAPGTGKTLLARAIAGEANAPFYFISGSDFVEMFVGVGASRVRDMFEEAKRNAPCIIFIDEIDAVGRSRGVGVGGGNDEREQTLNQLLVEMDGFEGDEGIIVIAATNREDVLDKALLRPGRFDRQITIQLPDARGREEILKTHAKKVKMAPNVDLASVAMATPGFSGAELANIINESGLLAARNNKKVVMNEDIEEAKERVMMGVKNQTKIKREEEIKLTAYHEAGHAVTALHCENSDPIYKATIISRGNAGGYVTRLPKDDVSYSNMTKARLEDDITVSMGGRAAEKIIFGENKITAGALGDIKLATKYAKNMVVSWGMSEKVGAVYYADKLRSEYGYGFEASSGDTLRLIDSEIRNIVENGKRRAENILIKYRRELDIVANALIKYETLTGDEIRELVAGRSIRNETEKENNKILGSSLLARFLSNERGNEREKETKMAEEEKTREAEAQKFQREKDIAGFANPEKVKNKRGRPKKSIVSSPIGTISQAQTDFVNPKKVKNKGGRPRKSIVSPPIGTISQAQTDFANPKKVKNKGGRPRKSIVPMSAEEIPRAQTPGRGATRTKKKLDAARKKGRRKKTAEGER